MSSTKSIEFLLENAGPVIQYRLRKEILNNISQTEEENLLERIYQTPHFKLIEGYIKPNGIIGGLTIADKDKHTRLQDCEAAARLLSNYAVTTLCQKTIYMSRISLRRFGTMMFYMRN